MKFLSLFIFGILTNDVFSFQVSKLNSRFILDDIALVSQIRGNYIFEIIVDARTVSTHFLKESRINVSDECEKFSKTYQDDQGLKVKCDQWMKVWNEKEEQYMYTYNSVFDKDFKILESESVGSLIGDWYEDRLRQDQINGKFSSNILDIYHTINGTIIFPHEVAVNVNKNTEILSHLSERLSNSLMKRERYDIICSVMNIANELYTLQYSKLLILNEITSDLQEGVLSSKLIKDSDIIQEMKSVSLDVNEELYINTTINDYNKILSLKKFGARWHNKTLHILLPIPVIDKDILEVKKNYPVPQLKENVVKTIDITTDFVIVSKDRSRYSLLPQNFFGNNGNCIRYGDRFYCEGINTFRTEEKSCIKNILTERNSSLCKLKAEIITDALVVPLKPNTFIITVPRRTQAKLVYTNGTVKNLFFEDTTLISNEEASILYISTLEIHFFLKFRGRIRRERTFRPLAENYESMIDHLIKTSRDIEIKKFDKLTLLNNDGLVSLSADITKAHDDLIAFSKKMGMGEFKQG